MAVLTAQPIYKIYQADAVNNIQETPVGTPRTDGIFTADGSINTATPGATPGIVAQNAPGVAAAVLSDTTIQQATNTIAPADPTSVGAGLQSNATVGVKSGNNSLQNDTSAMALGNASVPAPATGATLADGLSQSPQTQG